MGHLAPKKTNDCLFALPPHIIAGTNSSTVQRMKNK